MLVDRANGDKENKMSGVILSIAFFIITRPI